MRITKQDIQAIVNDIYSGTDSALLKYIQLTHLAKALDNAKDIIQPLAIQEADFHEDGFLWGTRFRVQSGRAKFDYSTSKEWLTLKQQEANLRKKRRNLEKQLQAQYFNSIDPVTGEIDAQAEFLEVGDPTLVIYATNDTNEPMPNRDESDNN